LYPVGIGGAGRHFCVYCGLLRMPPTGEAEVAELGAIPCIQ